jgi:hypothetical protein
LAIARSKAIQQAISTQPAALTRLL